MTRRTKVILAIIALVVLIFAVFAGVSSNKSGGTPKTTAAITTEIETAFKGADYFNKVEVQTYAGASSEAQTDAKAEADSASVEIVVNTLTASDFDDFATRLPKMDIITYYKVGVNDEAKYTALYGFSYLDFADEKKVKLISNALKARESSDTAYAQISPGDVTSQKEGSITVTTTTTENTVEATRELVDSYTNKNVDVVAINTPIVGSPAYVQTAAVNGDLDSFNNAVDFGLQFATATFTETSEISVLSLGKEVKINFGNVPEGVTKDTLQKAADDINTGNKFGLEVTVADPTAAAEETAPEVEPEE
jgi:hypothetical protein